MRKTLGMIIGLSVAAVAVAEDVVVLERTVVDTNALTFARGDKTRFSTHVNGRTHQQTPLVTHKGYQYTIYYNANRHVCVGRRSLSSNDWELIEFDDYVFESSDSHNTAVIGICEGDGTIHLAFDHHVSDLHYRVSNVGVADQPGSVEWDASLFGPVTDRLGSAGRINKVTYPRFFNAPNGNLMFSYRYVTSGNGDSTLQEYDAEKHDWTPGLGRFVARDIGLYKHGGEESKYRCAYMNNFMYAGDRLHASWVWRDRFEKTNPANQHDLCYAYSDDDGRTWRNNKGNAIGETGSSNVIHLDSKGLIVVPVERGLGLTNQNGQYAYPNGSVHVALLQAPKKGRPRVLFHHWRDASGTWKSAPLSFKGGRPKIVGDRDGTLFMFFEDNNSFCVAKGAPNANLTKWKWERIYQEKPRNIATEAVVDFTRWEKERVVSAYMQKHPEKVLSYGDGEMIDGEPSELVVYDYQISEFAAGPTPSADAVDVALETSLRWVSGIGAKAHHVYVGTKADRVAKAKRSSREFMGTLEHTEFSFPKKLRPDATFYWRVDSVLADGSIKHGLTWTFTTAASAGR